MQESSTRQRSSIPQQQETDAKLHPLNASSLASIQTAAGWQKVEGAEYVQTAVGQAYSPLSPTKWFPALRYRIPEGADGGKIVVTPMSHIISFSEEVVSPTNR